MRSTITHPSTNACAKTRTARLSKLVFKVGFATLLLLLVTKPNFAQVTSNAQTHLIKGVVTSDEDRTPMPGVNIFLKGSHDGTTTDQNGNFQFPRELKAGDILIFSFIGFETKEYIVPTDVASTIEINMISTAIEMMGAANVDEIYDPQKPGARKLLAR